MRCANITSRLGWSAHDLEAHCIDKRIRSLIASAQRLPDLVFNLQTRMNYSLAFTMNSRRLAWHCLLPGQHVRRRRCRACGFRPVAKEVPPGRACARAVAVEGVGTDRTGQET